MIDKKNIILIAIVILVIALAAVAAFIYTSGSSHKAVDNITNTTQNKTVINVDKVNNTTVVGDNTTRANNTANNTTAATQNSGFNFTTIGIIAVILVVCIVGFVMYRKR